MAGMGAGKGGQLFTASRSLCHLLLKSFKVSCDVVCHVLIGLGVALSQFALSNFCRL